MDTRDDKKFLRMIRSAAGSMGLLPPVTPKQVAHFERHVAGKESKRHHFPSADEVLKGGYK